MELGEVKKYAIKLATRATGYPGFEDGINQVDPTKYPTFKEAAKTATTRGLESFSMYFMFPGTERITHGILNYLQDKTEIPIEDRAYLYPGTTHLAFATDLLTTSVVAANSSDFLHFMGFRFLANIAVHGGLDIARSCLDRAKTSPLKIAF